MTEQTVPIEIEAIIRGKSYTKEEIGRSGAEILMFPDMVLKIEKTSETADNEYRTLLWLAGKLPAPRVLAFAKEGGMNYLLMTRLQGEMACAEGYEPETVVRGLANGLRSLWQMDITDCPASFSPEKELKMLKTYRESGGKDGEILALLDEILSLTPPSRELFFTHGDFCLPNIFLKDGEVAGYLDLGNAGIAEKWYDIATCLWSLSYNFKELGGMGDTEFQRMRALFFEELGMEPDEEKLRFYNLLDEIMMKVRGEA